MGMDYMMGKTAKTMIPLDSNICLNFGINITFGDKNKKRDQRELSTLTF